LCYRALRDGANAIADFKQAIILDGKRAAQVKKLLAKVDDEKSDDDEKNEAQSDAKNATDGDTKGSKTNREGQYRNSDRIQPFLKSTNSRGAV